ncbi:MAG: CvpA family protein [Bacteroidales bacterium]
MDLNYLDIIILSFLLGFAIRGFFRGLILSLASLLGLIAALYAAWHFSVFLRNELSSILHVEGSTVKILSFIFTFVGTIILFHLIGKLLEKVVKIAGLSFLNKLGGLILGLLKGSLWLSILFYIFMRIGGPTWLNPNVLNGSLLYDPVARLSGYMITEMGEFLNKNLEQKKEPPQAANIYTDKV